MKPAICCVCGKPAFEEPLDKKGAWVEFQNYKYSDESLSHPTGLEYFCGEHISQAKELEEKESGEALVELKKMFPSTSINTPATDQKLSWWKRLVKTIR